MLIDTRSRGEDKQAALLFGAKRQKLLSDAGHEMAAILDKLADEDGVLLLSACLTARVKRTR
jgi:hypothetical protein